MRFSRIEKMLNEKIIVQHFIMIKTAITEKHNIISHFVA